MGPRLFRRGNVTPEIVKPYRHKPELQWGHAFSDVEIPVFDPGVLLGVRYASMGPRLFRRGNGYHLAARHELLNIPLQWGHAFSDVEIRRRAGIQHVDAAGFNGATPFQTWKLDPLVDAPIGSSALQWGHAFSDVEMLQGGLVDKLREALAPLQWGHAFSDVEILMHLCFPC